MINQFQLNIISAFFLPAVFLLCLNVFAQNDWENPKLVSRNTLNPHAYFIPSSSEKEALQKTISPYILSLDGIWKFNLVNTPAERPLNFQDDKADISQWKNIQVPANWQVEGFDTFIFTDVEYPIPPNPPFVPASYNPVGSYKRTFIVPQTWKGKNVSIHLGAVNSFFYIWINGKFVGLSKDSKTPAEFDISSFIKDGENSVSVQVFRFSDGTYLEGQDMWKLSGIERSVYLIARPKTAIIDFRVNGGLTADYSNGVLTGDILFNNTLTDGQTVEIKLLDDAKAMSVVWSTVLDLKTAKTAHIETTISHARQWNAEHPELYTYIIDYKDKNGSTIESFMQKVGFRSVEIKNGFFQINGVTIKIKGVNRHEHDAKTGKVITVESMARDIQLMKQYNINAVRCSHYPNREEWYELCTKYGIYVVDEANIECDGMSFSDLKTLSDKPDWALAYLDRTKRMFERDKNFTSIITWSLGNESGLGNNFQQTYDYLKSVDNTRSVQYEPARKLSYTDIVCPMYKTVDFMLDYVKEHRIKPMIQCEYAHMMGNSGGNFADDWALIYKHEQLQGGFIWDFSDQTFKRKDAKGNDIWGYGRDMGQVGSTSDTSFCADGLFTSERSPHPQAFEVQKVYQPVSFEPISLSGNRFIVKNRFDFTNLSDYIITWKITAEDKIIQQGTLAALDVAAHQTKELTIPYIKITPEPGFEYFFWIEVKTGKADLSLPKNYRIAWEQFKLPDYTPVQKTTLVTSPSLNIEQHDSIIKISANKAAVSFNTKTGLLTSFLVQGTETLKDGFRPNFWRAATDNDIGYSMQIYRPMWQFTGKDIQVKYFQAKALNAQQYQVAVSYYLAQVDAMYIVNYIFLASGDLQVDLNFKAGNKSYPDLPRLGMRVLLLNEFDKVTWLGCGPFDNYQDRNTASAIALYTMPVDSMFHPYARAQESANRTNVRWMAMCNKDGLGLMAIGKPYLNTGALHFDMHDMDYDRHLKVNKHGGSFTAKDFIWWDIDDKQMGVGGDDSWGSQPHSEYSIPYKDYTYSFILRPVNAKSNLTQVAKTTYELKN